MRKWKWLRWAAFTLMMVGLCVLNLILTVVEFVFILFVFAVFCIGMFHVINLICERGC